MTRIHGEYSVCPHCGTVLETVGDDEFDSGVATMAQLSMAEIAIRRINGLQGVGGSYVRDVKEIVYRAMDHMNHMRDAEPIDEPYGFGISYCEVCSAVAGYGMKPPVRCEAHADLGDLHIKRFVHRFGSDAYTYADGDREVQVICGWGLMCPCETAVYVDDVEVKRIKASESRAMIEPEEALAACGLRIAETVRAVNLRNAEKGV